MRTRITIHVIPETLEEPAYYFVEIELGTPGLDGHVIARLKAFPVWAMAVKYGLAYIKSKRKRNGKRKQQF